MKWYQKLGWILGIALVSGILAYLAAPHVLRCQVESRVGPGIHLLGPIKANLQGITIYNVEIARSHVQGRLEKVFVAWNESVDVHGGTLDVDLNQGLMVPVELSGAPSKGSKTVSGLLVNVVKGNVRATITNVSWSNLTHDYCFDVGELTHPMGKVHIGYGCYQNGTLTASGVTTRIEKLPQIPGVTETSLEIVGQDVTVTRDGGDWILRAAQVHTAHLFGENISLTANKLGGIWMTADLMLHHPLLAPDGTDLRTIRLYVDPNHTDGTITSRDVTVRFDLQTQTLEGKAPCQKWVEALPEKLRPNPLPTLKFTGEMGFRVSLQPTPKLKLDSKCRVVCSSFPKLRGVFKYQAYNVDGSTFTRRSGPGSPNWVPTIQMGPMPMAVIQMEDPGFPNHTGYLTGAFQNSLLANVQTGKFLRGGSTITMQTAKNLWLGREKTLGRKFGELFLAQALESCLTKDQIMETYLNIVEFGPNVYGIGPGAKLWFGKSPEELTPTEAFWLAGILPAPKKARHPTEADLARVERFMARLASQGKIPDLVGEPVDSSGWEAP